LSTTSDNERHPAEDSTDENSTDWDATSHLTVTLLLSPTFVRRRANRSDRRKDNFVRAVRLHLLSALSSTLRGEFRYADATGRNGTLRNNSDTLFAKLRRGTDATNSDATVPFGTIPVVRALRFGSTRDGRDGLLRITLIYSVPPERDGFASCSANESQLTVAF
jgi:hypothetical protein